MHPHNQPLESLDLILREYVPSEEVCAELGRRSLFMFSGPFAVGKTTLMQNIESTSGDYSRVRSFTTRPCRSAEEQNNYRFIPHVDKSIEEIAAKATKGDLVQGMVHPTTKFIYGSELCDYGSGANALLDVVPKAVPSLERLPFRRSKIIEVVTLPDVWIDRVNSRGAQHNDRDRQARVIEARQNLSWALARSDVLWLDNSGNIGEVAERAVSLINNDSDQYDISARRLGEALLRQILLLEASFTRG